METIGKEIVFSDFLPTFWSKKSIFAYTLTSECLAEDLSSNCSSPMRANGDLSMPIDDNSLDEVPVKISASE